MRLPAARGPRRMLEILLVAAVVAAGGIAVHQLNLLLSRKMEEFKERSIAVLEARLGHEIRYRSISPSVLGFLAVRDLAFAGMLSLCVFALLMVFWMGRDAAVEQHMPARTLWIGLGAFAQNGGARATAELARLELLDEAKLLIAQ